MGKRLALLNTALLVILLLATVMGITPAMAADPPPPGNLTGIELPKYKVPGLDSGLAQLVKGQEKGQAAAVAQRLNIGIKDNKARVIIEAKPGKADAAAALARSLGADVETTYEDLVQVTVPVTALTALAGSDIISFVRRPYTSMPDAISQGVGLINASAWQAAGYTGAGTKVGILDFGFSGYAALLGTDLPATANVTTWWAPSIGGPGTETHGTACAEVVYDVAPGAQFYLANYGTDVEGANAVDWLISQGVNVISHSCSGYNGPGNGTGSSCTKVNDAHAAGITVAQSAGNYAQTHWGGTFNGDAFNYNKFQGTYNVNCAYVDAGQTVTAMLRWNDTWGASGNNYDLILVYWDGSKWLYADSSENVQDGDDDPFELLSGPLPIAGLYGLVIKKVAATGNASMDLMVWGSGALQYAVAAGSLGIPADSPNAIAVGAVQWDTPTTITPYSSQGPTTDGRVKPDLVAPSHVINVTYGSFGGTSASTPHVAGAALLVKNRYPTYTPAQIRSYLESNAVELGAAGKDNIFGSGRLYLPTACTTPGAPTLNLPANAGTISGSSGTFTWAAGTGTPTKYWLEINSSNTWGSGTRIYYADVGNVLSKTVTTLPANGSTLYWRIQPYNACGWGTWSLSRSFVNSCRPGTPTLSSPANASTVNGSSGTFSWTAGTGSPTKYWLEVNSSNTWGSGTRIYYADVGNVLSKTLTTLPASGATLYWRVQPYNACGWGTWSLTRNFINSVACTKPGAPTLNLPVNAGTISGSSGTFTWTAGTGSPTKYWLQINSNSGFTGTNYCYADVGNVTSKTVTTLPASGATLYWRVQPYNACGWGTWSLSRSFVNSCRSGAPTLSSPANASTVNGSSGTFTWAAGTGSPTKYWLQINSNSSFSGTNYYYADVGNVTSRTVTTLPNNGNTLYWRVQPYNACGWGTWSASSNFINSCRPGAPTLSTPANGASVPGASATFTWVAGTGSPTKYWLQVNTNSNFTGTNKYYAQVNGTSQLVSGLPNNGSTLYWRVQAGNDCGWSPWSASRSFTNSAACTKPGAPTLNLPAIGATVSGSAVTFAWTAGTGTPTKYWLQVNTNSNFTGTNKYYAQVNGTSQLVSGLPANGSTLYWRVQAGNTCGWSPWSASRNFVNGP